MTGHSQTINHQLMKYHIVAQGFSGFSQFKSA